MPATGRDSGIVNIDADKVAELAVHSLSRLNYHITSATPKTFGRILARQEKREQIGRDWWNYNWILELDLEPVSDGVLVTVSLKEETGCGTDSECAKRCDQLIRTMQQDARRAQVIDQRREKPTTHGAARWADLNDLDRAGYLETKVDPGRTLLTKVESQFVSVPQRETYKHALVCGRTGVGKSSGFFIPNLIERLGTNMLVTEAIPEEDELGELYSLTAGWRQQAGHAIYSFNPADMTSTRINPIDSVRFAPKRKMTGMAKKIAELIISAHGDTQRADKTWDLSEKQLLYPLILHAAASPPDQGHFGYIRSLLMKGVDNIPGIIQNSPSALAVEEYWGWYNNTSENFRRGVAAGLVAKLTPWQTDEIMELTATTDLDLKVLENQLFTIYLSVPVRDPDSKIVAALVFNYLLDILLKLKKRMKRPLALFLDEFTNFGYIPGIQDVLSIVRKMEISLVLGFQNYSQLDEVYGSKKASIIIDQPGTQIYFRQKNFKEAKQLSDALGRTTVEERTVTDTGKVQEHIYGRNLMTPDELINLPMDEVIVFTPDTGPLKVKKFAPGIYQHATGYPPPEREEHVISDFIKNRHRSKKTDKIDDSPAPAEEAITPNENETQSTSAKEVDSREDPPRPQDERERNRAEKEPDIEDKQTPYGDDEWQL